MAIIQKVVLILLFFALVACQKNLTYSHLMQHPKELKQAIEYCQTNGRNENSASCETVMRAAADMISIITQQQQNPESFGERLMQLELACVTAKDNLKLAQQKLATLEEQKSSSDPKGDMKLAQENVDKAKQTLHDNREQIKIMLAVIGLNSPE